MVAAGVTLVAAAPLVLRVAVAQRGETGVKRRKRW
jgi:hypothetical protein